MKRVRAWLFTGLSIALFMLPACSQAPAPSEEALHIEELASGLKALTLTARAADRLGIQTADVRDDGQDVLVPYASLIYDADGVTWVYVATEPLRFERAEIVVESVAGEDAVVTDGPPGWTPVVIVGAAERYGAETGVGGGH